MADMAEQTMESVQIIPEIPEDLDAELEEFYCAKCGRFLGYVAVIEGTIAIKCRRCKFFSIMDCRLNWGLDKCNKPTLQSEDERSSLAELMAPGLPDTE